jgi:Tol biopolymer transport system component
MHRPTAVGLAWGGFVLERRVVLSGRPWLRAWLVVGLAAWITLGVLLVTRANNLGLIDDISLSPYHVVGYAALLVLALYVGWSFFGSLRRGAWRQALPPLYGGLGLGLVLLLVWVVFDPIWRDTLGIAQSGIENGLAPTRLLIPIALVLLAAGPLREAIALRAERGLRPGELPIRWAGVVATGLIGSALTMAAFNPIQTPVQDWSYLPAVDNSEIWTMAADGSGQTRLLAALGDGVDYSLPAWSPDGTRIAYTTWTNNDGAPQNLRNSDQTAAIWTMAADGSDRRLLVDDCPSAPCGSAVAHVWIPAWSPDGQWLAYSSTQLFNRGSIAPPPQPTPEPAPDQAGPPSAARGSSIWVIRVDGTGAQRLTPEGVDATGAVWSPDGLRLAYIAGVPGGESDIHVANINVGMPGAVPAGGPPAIIGGTAVAGDPANDWGPAWAPDGQSLAFTSDRSGSYEVWTVEVAGSEPNLTQLTDDGADDWVPVYSPDGMRIAFVSDRTGEPEIWSMATDGSDLRNLTNHPQHFDGTWSVSWSPDGSRLAYGNAAFQDAATSGWVREDLAAAAMLLFGLALAAVALVVVALGAPFGAFAIVLLIVVLGAAIPVDGWRFLPAAAIAGLAVDLLVRAVRPRWRSRVAAAALPAFATLGVGLTVGAGGTLAWSLTLLLGVTLASALLGWGLAEAVERLLPRQGSPETVPAARTA